MLCAGSSAGIAQSYPIADAIAQKVIANYQNSSCEQLQVQKSQPPSAQQQKVVNILRGDPQLRVYFLNKVAAPIVNRMFECGMIP